MKIKLQNESNHAILETTNRTYVLRRRLYGEDRIPRTADGITDRQQPDTDTDGGAAGNIQIHQCQLRSAETHPGFEDADLDCRCVYLLAG